MKKLDSIFGQKKAALLKDKSFYPAMYLIIL